MNQPLVSVICLCHNQAQFVTEALLSVINQTYQHIEIIIIDDASIDESVGVINKIITEFPLIQFLEIEKNIGNCRAFNQGFAISKGDYIIDFAADDVMNGDRIAKQIAAFQALSMDYGVVFSDAVYVDAQGNFLRQHYEYLFQKRLLKEVPQGDVYANIVSVYFIASPTMMVKRNVFVELNGYDENLVYEDFDFWVRSARIFKYAFVNETLTKIRKSRKSMSTGWYKQGDLQLHSTYLICKKIKKLNRDPKDVEALIKRVRFEIRQSVFSKNIKEAELFYTLLTELINPNCMDRLLINIRHLPFPFRFIRNLYHIIRYN